MTSRALPLSGTCSAALIFAASLLAGCGANKPVTLSSPPGSTANITGNWELTANTTVGQASIGVYLTSNAGSVWGIAVGPLGTDNIAFGDGCVGSPIGPFGAEALTGTVDADGNLKLGPPASGSPESFTMTSTVSGSTVSNGSFSLNCVSTVKGTITGTEYPPLEGTYSGTVTSQVTGQSFTMSATLDQSSAPNSDGYLGLTGTVGVTGYPCISSAAMPISSNFVGNEFWAGLNPAPNATLGWAGTLSPDGKTLAIGYGFTLNGSGCNGDFGTGTLTLQ